MDDESITDPPTSAKPPSTRGARALERRLAALRAAGNKVTPHEGERGQAWGLMTIESFHIQGTPPLPEGPR